MMAARLLCQPTLEYNRKAHLARGLANFPDTTPMECQWQPPPLPHRHGQTYTEPTLPRPDADSAVKCSDIHTKTE